MSLIRNILWGTVAGISLGALFISLSRKKKTVLGKGISCSSRFLFVGDSTTASANSFADKLKSICPAAKIKKIAGVGQKTNWMLNQMTNDIKSGSKYDVVTILGGSNDIFALGSIADTKNNLESMYVLAKAQGSKVVAITPPSKLYYEPTTDKHRALIAELTNWIKNNPLVDYFIDLGSLVTDKSLFASDNQHITHKGHDILKNEFVNKLKLA